VHLVREGQERVVRLDGRLQGVPFSTVLERGHRAALPETLYLYLGTHFHLEECESDQSWFDDLEIEVVR